MDVTELMDGEIHTKMYPHIQVFPRTSFSIASLLPLELVHVVWYMQVYICVYIYTRMINKTLYMYNCSVCVCVCKSVIW